MRRSFPLSFMPLVPYPPLRGTFPSRGRLTIRGSRHLKYGEAATRALSPSYQSLRAAKSQDTHPVCSGFSIGGKATPSFFISPTSGARPQVLPCREAWLCIEICRKSDAVMGSASPRLPLPPPSSLRYNIFKETLIKSQSQILQEFLYIASS